MWDQKRLLALPTSGPLEETAFASSSMPPMTAMLSQATGMDQVSPSSRPAKTDTFHSGVPPIALSARSVTTALQIAKIYFL